MRRLKLTSATLLGCALIALLPASAASAKAKAPESSVVVDCQDHSGTLTRHYTNAQLRQALNTLPSTIAEYGTCEQLIENQLLRQEGKRLKGGGTGQSSSGGSSSTVLIVVIVVVVVLLLVGGGFLYSRRRTGGGDS